MFECLIGSMWCYFGELWNFWGGVVLLKEVALEGKFLKFVAILGSLCFCFLVL